MNALKRPEQSQKMVYFRMRVSAEEQNTAQQRGAIQEMIYQSFTMLQSESWIE